MAFRYLIKTPAGVIKTTQNSKTKSFKSKSTQKSTQESIQIKLFSSQSSSQASDLQVGASYSQDDNKSDEEEKNDDEKISFYLKLGKNKKFKFM